MIEPRFDASATASAGITFSLSSATGLRNGNYVMRLDSPANDVRPEIDFEPTIATPGAPRYVFVEQTEAIMATTTEAGDRAPTWLLVWLAVAIVAAVVGMLGSIIAPSAWLLSIAAFGLLSMGVAGLVERGRRERGDHS